MYGKEEGIVDVDDVFSVWSVDPIYVVDFSL